MSEPMLSLFDDDVTGQPVRAGSKGKLATEREGVLVYEKKVSWIVEGSGKHLTTLKRPHYQGVCAACYNADSALTPEGIDAAVRSARSFCIQTCPREHCSLLASARKAGED